jgi:hypothetical protein
MIDADKAKNNLPEVVEARKKMADQLEAERD